MSTGILAARVLQGIAVMDLHHGPQWVWRVDTHRLDINHPCRCVIGQVAQCDDWLSYDDAARRLGIDGEAAAVAAGFFPPFAEGEPALNRIWSYAIRRLREQRPREVAA